MNDPYEHDADYDHAMRASVALPDDYRFSTEVAVALRDSHIAGAGSAVVHFGEEAFQITITPVKTTI